MFCEIDFVAIKIEPELEFPFVRARVDEQEKIEKLKVKIDTSNVNIDDLMGRIRHHVLINRIRVSNINTTNYHRSHSCSNRLKNFLKTLILFVWVQ